MSVTYVEPPEAVLALEEEGWLCVGVQGTSSFPDAVRWNLTWTNGAARVCLATETHMMRDEWKLYLRSACCGKGVVSLSGLLYCKECRHACPQEGSTGRMASLEENGFYPEYAGRVESWFEAAGLNVLESGMLASDAHRIVLHLSGRLAARAKWEAAHA